jgi:hypothetical protein
MYAMKNKIVISFFALLLVGVSYAQKTFVANGITYQIIREADGANANGLAEVTYKRDGSTYSGSIQIPNAVKETDDPYSDTYKIIGIGEKAFALCKQLRSVELPATLEYIGNYAFQHNYYAR